MVLAVEVEVRFAVEAAFRVNGLSVGGWKELVGEDEG